MLRRPDAADNWYLLCITLLALRLVASILSLFVFTQRKRLQAPKKELPQELQNLSPKQKKALNKIAQGEVLDVKMSGALGGANRDDQAQRRRTAMAAMEAAGVEERGFVAFNVQLRTLRWGWQNALGIDQLVKVEIDGPGAEEIHLRKSGGEASHLQKGEPQKTTEPHGALSVLQMSLGRGVSSCSAPRAQTTRSAGRRIAICSF